MWTNLLTFNRSLNFLELCLIQQLDSLQYTAGLHLVWGLHYVVKIMFSGPSLSVGFPFPEPLQILNSESIQTCGIRGPPPGSKMSQSWEGFLRPVKAAQNRLWPLQASEWPLVFYKVTSGFRWNGGGFFFFQICTGWTCRECEPTCTVKNPLKPTNANSLVKDNTRNTRRLTEQQIHSLVQACCGV